MSDTVTCPKCVGNRYIGQSLSLPWDTPVAAFDIPTYALRGYTIGRCWVCFGTGSMTPEDVEAYKAYLEKTSIKL